MSEVHPVQSTASTSFGGATAPLGVVQWLRLAAMPTFAIMALVTAMGGSPMEGLCSSGHGAPFSGMLTMYLLMSAFHAPPWLNMILGQPAPRNLG